MSSTSHPLDAALETHVARLEEQGTAKGAENVIVRVLAAEGDRGPRCLLEGQGDKLFLKMNSNSYLGLSAREELLHAEEEAARSFGSGPGAVRFISGTYRHHTELERRLAAFHGRESGMIFSAAYATVLGVLVPLVDRETTVISDELNHNCIINAMRLARPKEKMIYGHLEMAELRKSLAGGTGRRAILVTDGIFSMRGSHAPLREIVALAREHDARYEEGVTVVVDDSHGVGAFGRSGRGTEEYAGARGDVLVGTLGKAFGVNGGYVVGSAALTRFLRESAPTYIYSNPITVGECAAALASLDILESDEGPRRLDHLQEMTTRFAKGIVDIGWETIPGDHPVTPLMVRETEKTAALVEHLFDHGILATGLNYPVVPKGDQSIRFQINADHTARDIDEVLTAIEDFGG
ncbi:MAG: aminotransferase class I/II-fold pyridoxal phosphate-dependent enzyme [Thermoanaerobaculia bacterium]|nr:aminotransferase class I/II-fold pyridoxal phosphate-dependent enzyme [Thermoanaerobaculia bacterium]